MNSQRRTAGQGLLRAVIGAISGTVATGPMTVAMILLHRRLPGDERYALPPHEITVRAAEWAGINDNLRPEDRYAATLVAHFGYGAGVGTLYGAVERFLPMPPVAKGAVFGTAVWLGSYLGLLPVVGVLTPATEHPAKRSALMIAVHLVWGVVAGLMVELFMKEARTPGRRPFPGHGDHGRDVPD